MVILHICYSSDAGNRKQQLCYFRLNLYEIWSFQFANRMFYLLKCILIAVDIFKKFRLEIYKKSCVFYIPKPFMKRYKNMANFINAVYNGNSFSLFLLHVNSAEIKENSVLSTS